MNDTKTRGVVTEGVNDGPSIRPWPSSNWTGMVLPPGNYFFKIEAAAQTASTGGVQLTLTTSSGDIGNSWCSRMTGLGFGSPQSSCIRIFGATVIFDDYPGAVSLGNGEASGYLITTATNNYTVYYKCLTAGDTNQPQLLYGSYLQFIKLSYP